MKFDQLVQNIQGIDESLKLHLGRSANVALTIRNWLIGAYIVEFEQDGEERAAYGEALFPKLADQLTIKGLSKRNLASSKNLYLEYPEILQTASAKFNMLLDVVVKTISNPLNQNALQISQTLSALFGNDNRSLYAIKIALPSQQEIREFIIRESTNFNASIT